MELIRTYPNVVLETDGRVFACASYGRQRADGRCEGRIVFFPLDGGSAVATDRETTQPRRASLEYWADGLIPTFLQGALARALRRGPDATLDLPPPPSAYGDAVASATRRPHGDRRLRTPARRRAPAWWQRQTPRRRQPSAAADCCRSRSAFRPAPCRPLRGPAPADRCAGPSRGGRRRRCRQRARALRFGPDRACTPGRDRSADRPRRRAGSDDPCAVPAAQEQPRAGRRPGRRQDRHRRRTGACDRAPAGARAAEKGTESTRSISGASWRAPAARRVRGAPDGRRFGDPERSRRDPVHRRDPHDRGRRRLDRQHAGCVEPAQAGAVGRPALHRLDHVSGIPGLDRARSRARPPLPEDRRPRAVDRRDRADPDGRELPLREASPCAIHARGAACGRRAVGPVPARPAAPRQGDRSDRRGGRRPAAVGRPGEATGGRRARDRGGGGADGRRAGANDLGLRPGAAARPGAGAQAGDLRPGRRGGSAGAGHQAGPRRRSPAGPAHRIVPVLRPDRSRQDRAGQAARAPAGSRVPALRHERVHGEAHGGASDRRAARVHRLRAGRAAHRRRAQEPICAWCCSTRSRRRIPMSSTSCCR